MPIFDGLPDVFTGAFGQAVRIFPTYGSSGDIQAIFRKPNEPDLVDPGAVSSQTEIHARTADLVNLQHGDLIEVNGVTYRAGAMIPDDKGMTRVTLMSRD